ncbi:MAG: hypothetical protein EX285_08630 [Thaumarchaeota archaeon]|nr:hypothetical protein [Nitrososphaerota archaeon]
MHEWINDDCFNIFPSLETGSAQLIFTSVPDLNDLGMDEYVEKYETYINSALSEFARITNDNGFIALCQTDRKINAQIYSKHSILIQMMQDFGYVLKDYKIIVKNIDSKDQYKFPYQHLCVFTRKGTITSSGSWLRHIFIYDMKKSEIGPFYTWNDAFVKLVIGSLTQEDQLVIDPFAGSGIVPYVAKEMNRQYLGIEIDERLYKARTMVQHSSLSDLFETK